MWCKMQLIKPANTEKAGKAFCKCKSASVFSRENELRFSTSNGLSLSLPLARIHSSYWQIKTGKKERKLSN